METRIDVYIVGMLWSDVFSLSYSPLINSCTKSFHMNSQQLQSSLKPSLTRIDVYITGYGQIIFLEVRTFDKILH